MDATSLPDPDPDALERSRGLSALIANEIGQNGGVIGFDRFMELALYHPRLGYYAGNSPIFGIYGDYITAPESGQLFANCIARQCMEVQNYLGGSITEYGAGSGRLACGLLQRMQKLNSVPDRYLIVEKSPQMRQRQRALIQKCVPELSDRVRWYDEHPKEEVSGIVIANELLDAMPVKRIVVAQGEIKELGVELRDGRFSWLPMATTERIIPEGAMNHWFRLPDNYVSEFNPNLVEWLGGLSESVDKCVVLLIDYGYPRHEYLHESRRFGTLKCHYQHRIHNDPFYYPGLQDITTAVDFTTVAEIAAEIGFDVTGFTTQTSFLTSCGLERLMQNEQTDDPVLRYERGQEAKRLLLPSEMGQICKVMALAKRFKYPLLGFGVDERHRLTGFNPV